MPPFKLGLSDVISEAVSTLVSENLLIQALAEQSLWIRSSSSIQRTFTFPSFQHAIAFVNKVADLSETIDHHPEIEIYYRSVRLSLTTHSAGGLTMLDVNAAKRIGELFLEEESRR